MTATKYEYIYYTRLADTLWKKENIDNSQKNEFV